MVMIIFLLPSHKDGRCSHIGHFMCVKLDSHQEVDLKIYRIIIFDVDKVHLYIFINEKDLPSNPNVIYFLNEHIQFLQLFVL